MFDVDHDAERAAALGVEVNGFSFEGMDAPGMDYALNRCGFMHERGSFELGSVPLGTIPEHVGIAFSPPVACGCLRADQ